MQHNHDGMLAQCDIVTSLPQHIRRQWLPVIARFQQMASSQSGIAIVSMTVVVDQDGNPICWSEPDMTKVEPRSRADLIHGLLASP